MARESRGSIMDKIQLNVLELRNLICNNKRRSFSIFSKDGDICICKYDREYKRYYTINEYSIYGNSIGIAIDLAEYYKLADNLTQLEAWDIFAILTNGDIFIKVKEQAQANVKSLIESGRIRKEFSDILDI